MIRRLIYSLLVTGILTVAAFAQGVVQSPNLFWATPLSGTGYLGLRAIGAADLGAITSPGLSGVITDTQTIGATSTDGLLLDNATAAGAGAQQWSPRVHWSGMGWKTNATAGSQSVDVIEELQAVQGAANPTGNLVWSGSVNGVAYGVLLTLPTTGGLNLNSGTYQIGGAQIAFSNIAGTASLTTQVTGLLPIANGGNGTGSPGITAGNGISVSGSWPTQQVTASTGGATNGAPANPTGTASGTGVMMGLAVAITPTKTGNIMLAVSGDASNSSTGACFMTLRFGTGTAPTNGAALTGTTVGHSVSEGTGVAALTFPFSLAGVLTAQTLSTALWIDLSLTSSTGTCTVTNINIAAMEQ